MPDDFQQQQHTVDCEYCQESIDQIYANLCDYLQKFMLEVKQSLNNVSISHQNHLLVFYGQNTIADDDEYCNSFKNSPVDTDSSMTHRHHHHSRRHHQPRSGDSSCPIVIAVSPDPEVDIKPTIDGRSSGKCEENREYMLSNRSSDYSTLNNDALDYDDDGCCYASGDNQKLHQQKSSFYHSSTEEEQQYFHHHHDAGDNLHTKDDDDDDDGIMIFECHLCGREFSSENELDDHLFEHKQHQSQASSSSAVDALQFVCDVCGYGFPDDVILHHHKIIHQLGCVVVHGDRCYKCGICEKYIQGSVSHFNTHLLSHYNNNRPTTTLLSTTNSSSSTCTHYSTFQTTEQGVGKIEEKMRHSNKIERNRGKKLSKSRDVAVAMQQKLLPSSTCQNEIIKNNFLCSLCNKSFPTKKSLHCHRDYKHREKRFECKTCSKRFSYNCHLRTHYYRSHHISKVT